MVEEAEKGLGVQPLLQSGLPEYRSQPLPILNILVPHVGQTPCVAGLPFFMVMALASFISLLARHFIQYACMASPFLSPLTCWFLCDSLVGFSNQS